MAPAGPGPSQPSSTCRWGNSMRCGSGEMSQRDRSSASVRSVSRRPCQFFHVQDIELIFILLPKSDSHFFQRLSLMDHPLSATISRGPPAAISHVPSALYHRCRYLSTIYPSITCLIIWILPDNFTDHYYFVASLYPIGGSFPCYNC